MKKPITLIILDGWGYRTDAKDNAILAADTPYFDYLWNTYPHTLLEASGEAVGLPEGQVGNSEIGHTTIGAGTTIDTDLVRIKKSIDNGEFANNEAFLNVFSHVQQHGSRLHIIGLLSDGGVHSHQSHLFSLLRVASLASIRNIGVHVFTDGRDTAVDGSQNYIQELENVLRDLDCGSIASITGRYWAMDRDNNWDRVERALDALFECKGGVCEIDPGDYVKALHEKGISDEHIEPTVIQQADGSTIRIGENDGIIFLNFRSDRARMITEKLIERKGSMNLAIATMTQYRSDFDLPVAFPAKNIVTTLAREIADAGMHQVHIAETEKFPHATYFLNGGRETPHDNEEHILVPSRKDVATHDLAPEMRAMDIAEKAVASLEQGLDFLFVNIANPDMVGHTANVPAIITAIETTDKAMERIVRATLDAGGVAIVTADHGNAETNRETDGSLHTAHTYNLVPCIVTESDVHLMKQGTLADLAPTVLAYLDINQPSVMTGVNIVRK